VVVPGPGHHLDAQAKVQIAVDIQQVVAEGRRAVHAVDGENEPPTIQVPERMARRAAVRRRRWRVGYVGWLNPLDLGWLNFLDPGWLNLLDLGWLNLLLADRGQLPQTYQRGGNDENAESPHVSLLPNLENPG